MNQEDQLIPLYHKLCGGIAMYTRGYIPKGAILRSSQFVHNDGTPARMFERMLCDTCRRPFVGATYYAEDVSEKEKSRESI